MSGEGPAQQVGWGWQTPDYLPIPESFVSLSGPPIGKKGDLQAPDQESVWLLMSFHRISPAGEMLLLKKKLTLHVLEPDATTAINSQL